jgi:hypothetical protein
MGKNWENFKNATNPSPSFRLLFKATSPYPCLLPLFLPVDARYLKIKPDGRNLPGQGRQLE